MNKILQIFALSLVVCANAIKSKINPNLQFTFQKNEFANVIISFDGTSSTLSEFGSQQCHIESRGTKNKKLQYYLAAHTNSVQQSTVAILQANNAHFESFWISNQIAIINATRALVERLSQISEVSEVHEELVITLEKPIGPSRIISNSSIVQNEWQLEDIDAPLAWAAGFTGKGVTVAVIDSGARYTHEALVNGWRSENGWFDPCKQTSKPNDAIGHGTHCTGSIIKRKSIGVAPEAQWIACKGCNLMSCTEAALLSCGQWIVCPTDSQGQNPRCDLSPNVVSNSWGGGKDNPFYNEVVAAWKIAGIIPVFAIGNSGPLCSSVNSPGDQSNVISVGSTNKAHRLSIFSGKGPSQGGLLKPDISAPGTAILSAFNNGDSVYRSLDGTSMAAPHVSGVIALMLQANPNLTYEEVLDILRNYSDHDLVPTIRSCGRISTSKFPNNSFGYGKVNAHKATQAARKLIRKNNL